MGFSACAVGVAVAGPEGREQQEGGRGGGDEEVGGEGGEFEGEGQSCIDRLEGWGDNCELGRFDLGGMAFASGDWSAGIKS